MVDLALLQSVSYIAGALGVCVAAAYYVMTLRISLRNQEISLKNQELMLKAQEQSTKAQQQNLETRQAQLFMQIFDRGEENDVLQNWVSIMGTSFNNYEEFKSNIVNDPIKIMTLNRLVYFFEGVGVLVKENLIDIRLVAEFMAGITRKFWEKIEPVIDEYEAESNFRRYTSETRYLYGRLMEYISLHPELAP